MNGQWDPPPSAHGVRLKAVGSKPPGNLHMIDPTTIRRRTRCGIRVTADTIDRWETGVPASIVPAIRRCMKCFPGTGTRT